MAGKTKEIEIVKSGKSHMYVCKFVGGGELPDILKSEYTSIKEAEKWRDMYYAGKRKMNDIPNMKIRPSEEVK